MRRRLALRFPPPLDGRCSQVASATPPRDIGSGSDRRPRLSSGVSPLGMTARTRARTVAPRCRRAEWTLRVVSVRRSQDSHASHARSVRAPMHRPSPVASRRKPALACGRWRLFAIWFTRSHEDVGCAAGAGHHRKAASGCGEEFGNGFADGVTSSWLRVNQPSSLATIPHPTPPLCPRSQRRNAIRLR